MTTTTEPDTAAIREALHGPGLTACKGAFETAWADELREDVEREFASARQREGGAVGRGPKRWYVECHPEALRGFADIASHPWFTSVCETVLGPDYQIIEVGFDIPFEGAMNQPWHRDFPSPPETHVEGRLTSLAFNLTCVDTEPDMGPFEIAPGTQFLSGADWKHQMFPDKSEWPTFEAVAERRYPMRGDISARSALTVHRGTRNDSARSRPVVVIGVDAPGAGNDAHHEPQVTRAYWESLPDVVRAHLSCPVVDELTPIVQKHQIEGLVMGEA
ncbi:phytanoyl-CoA dioxygenase family protein [Auraticoccus monumenti]|uniref:Phytanoyl-CoA dioxygenase (PhyH) n=1 Tax=Auraticoccus monumenti TaxID=675864 RepID=A0A1G6TXW6_9ACTN|nr:phytanoyl-CoA dioxygenase family protein [Auraticoccus monumenti]SDD33901.1 Phytanoyl-CoA dioxygenase (PhyH) [Auraticoccus monumenti]